MKWELNELVFPPKSQYVNMFYKNNRLLSGCNKAHYLPTTNTNKPPHTLHTCVGEKRQFVELSSFLLNLYLIKHLNDCIAFLAHLFHLGEVKITHFRKVVIPRTFLRVLILLKVGHNSGECFSASANVPALVVLADGHAHKTEVTQHLKETFLHCFHVQEKDTQSNQ